MSPWKLTVAREDWLSMYVDDPLRTEIIVTDDFSIAKKIYDEQKEIPNQNGLLYEINISIYFKGFCCKLCYLLRLTKKIKSTQYLINKE